MAAVSRACPRWLANEREDLVQASLLRVVEAVGGVASLDVKATYLWKTAASVTIDEVRRARWRHERSLDEVTSQRDDDDPSVDPERALAAREIADAVRACLDRLEPARRHAVLLRLAGFSHAEAGKILGLSPKQVTNLTFRGMQDLRRLLRDRGIRA
jgi:RNA polymerase sigma-70 factor (ECF subfamily)